MASQQRIQKLLLIVALAITTLAVGTETSQTRGLKADEKLVLLGVIGAGETERRVYYGNASKYDYVDAKWLCTGEETDYKGGLLTVDSEEEAQFLKDNLNSDSGLYYWTAGKQVASLDNYVWEVVAGAEHVELIYKPSDYYYSAEKPDTCLAFYTAPGMEYVFYERLCNEVLPALCEVFV